MNQGTLKSWCIYTLIIGVWVGLIAGILYLGHTWGEPEEASTTPTHGRVLRLLVWGDMFDRNFLKKFEAQTGTTIQMSSYDTNEELIVKLKLSDSHGYDIIAPSDYAVQILREANLLRPLDHTKMPFLTDINPLLLGQAYDPDNTFSVPYEWEVYGIAYHKEFFAQHPQLLHNSLNMFFKDPAGAFRVIISDDALEVIRLAAHFLWGKVDELTEQQIDEVQALLSQQHAWVEAYTRTNLDYYLISGYSPVAFASSAYVAKRRNLADKLGFFVPKEGGLITIENLAVPLHAENDDLIYAFLNFVMSSESMTHHFNKFTYFPSTLNVEEPTYIPAEIRALRTMSADDFSKLIFVKALMPEERMNHLWVSIK